jgi:hypothetical protein
LLLAGCEKKDAGKEEEEKPKNPLLGDPQAGAGGIRRVVDRPKVQNDLRNLATLYQAFETEMNRAPKTLDEFKGYIKRDAGQLHQRLSDGYYVLVLVKKPTSNVILAYEKAPDAKGIHMAVRGDGSVTSMNAAELEKALKVTE